MVAIVFESKTRELGGHASHAEEFGLSVIVAKLDKLWCRLDLREWYVRDCSLLIGFGNATTVPRYVLRITYKV